MLFKTKCKEQRRKRKINLFKRENAIVGKYFEILNNLNNINIFETGVSQTTVEEKKRGKNTIREKYFSSSTLVTAC